jgi:hypothetical protein
VVTGRDEQCLGLLAFTLILLAAVVVWASLTGPDAPHAPNEPGIEIGVQP